MQTVAFTHDAVIAGDMADLFRQLSVFPPPPSVRSIEVHRGLVEATYGTTPVEFTSTGAAPARLPDVAVMRDGVAWVVFSGGKDSVAVAYLLMEEGLRVEAVHVHGHRKALAQERGRAEIVAWKMSIPFRSIRVLTTGKMEYRDSPIANQMMIACIADVGYREGVMSYALGAEADCHADDVSWEARCDSTESMDAMRSILQAYDERINLRLGLLRSETHSLCYLATKHPDILVECRGCLCRSRFREVRRRHNIKKFGVNVPEGRCGSCQKCAVEYLVLELLGFAPHHESYDQHCRKTLIRHLIADWGVEYAELARQTAYQECVDVTEIERWR